MIRTRSLKRIMVLMVLAIMVVSNLLTAICVFILYWLNILDNFHFTPLLLSFIALLVSILIGTVLSAIISNKILKPMNELIAATRRVAKGDFSVRVHENGLDNQLGELLSSFNFMTKELAGIELFKKDFIDIFSHEFKTPIVSLRGFAKELQNEDLSADQRKEYTDIIISETERMAKMSSNILLLTKVENQQMVSDKTEFSLDEQIRDCILLLAKQWQMKEIEWNLELDEVSLFGNEELLSQIWLNLLGNAIKYSYTQGSISVRCHIAINKVSVVIADQGVGIEREALSHIFDKFYQEDISHFTEGNGLGLSIVRRIVELCNGHITVESAKGHGTVFYVELPIEKQG